MWWLSDQARQYLSVCQSAVRLRGDMCQHIEGHFVLSQSIVNKSTAFSQDSSDIRDTLYSIHCMVHKQRLAHVASTPERGLRYISSGTSLPRCGAGGAGDGGGWGASHLESEFPVGGTWSHPVSESSFFYFCAALNAILRGSFLRGSLT